MSNMGNISKQLSPFIDLSKHVFRKIGIIAHEGDEDEFDHDAENEYMVHRPEYHTIQDIPSTATLNTYQTSVIKSGIKHYIDNPQKLIDTDSGSELPTVYERDGSYWIYDGHHRIAASRLRGESSFKARVWNNNKMWS